MSMTMTAIAIWTAGIGIGRPALTNQPVIGTLAAVLCFATIGGRAMDEDAEVVP